MRSSLAVIPAVIAVLSLASCGGSVRSVFRPSDPSFRPAPGPRPRVYLQADLASIPRGPMRSVGIIEVTVPERRGIAAAAEAAAEQGRELGCWIVVEHGAFDRARERASLTGGARVVLAHGPGGHMHEPSARGKRRTVQFDCVVRMLATWHEAARCESV